MRVFMIVLALAYWGLALLAQSYLSRVGEAPAFESAEFVYGQEEPTIERATCEETPDDALFAAASFNAAAEPEINATAC